MLMFFTPVLQNSGNFTKTNQYQRNVLHCLLAGNQTSTAQREAPFNYLPSMMLFERNETLHNAKC